MLALLSACGPTQFTPAVQQPNFALNNGNNAALLQSQSSQSVTAPFRFQRIGKLSVNVNTSSLVNIAGDYDVQYGEQVIARNIAFRYNLTDKQVVGVENRGGDTANWDQIQAECMALMKLKLKL